MPIHWAVENLFTLQILQPIGVVGENLRDFEGADPKGVELAVLAFILSGCIPFKYQVPDFELLFLNPSVKSLLDPLLMIVGSVHDLLPGLLHFHHLMNPSNHMVGLLFKVLEEFCHR